MATAGKRSRYLIGSRKLLPLVATHRVSDSSLEAPKDNQSVLIGFVIDPESFVLRPSSRSVDEAPQFNADPHVALIGQSVDVGIT